jgi:hypothetical protein
MNIAPVNVDPALAMLRNGNADLVTGKRSLASYAETERSLSRLAAGAAVQASRPKSAAKAFRLCGVMSAPYSSMSQVGLVIVRTLGDTVLR